MMTSGKIILNGVSKSYGELQVLKQLNLELDSGRTYCLMGPSGSGKTTLLRLILGLELPDCGTITSGLATDGSLHLTAVFQEDRLCEAFSPLENIMMAAGRFLSPETARQELCRLLPSEAVSRPAATLSGGMKRRVAILRALLTPSCGILMDEPFTGLDEDTKQTVVDYIKEKSAGRLLLVSTHQEEDVAALGGTLITLAACQDG